MVNIVDIHTCTYVALKTEHLYAFLVLAGNEDKKFEIDASTGDLILVNRLDREKKSIYYLDVQAYNEKPETDYTVIRYRRAIDRSIITVKISVGDVNDLAPVFLDDKYFGCKFIVNDNSECRV